MMCFLQKCNLSLQWLHILKLDGFTIKKVLYNQPNSDVILMEIYPNVSLQNHCWHAEELLLRQNTLFMYMSLKLLSILQVLFSNKGTIGDLSIIMANWPITTSKHTYLVVSFVMLLWRILLRVKSDLFCKKEHVLVFVK